MTDEPLGSHVLELQVTDVVEETDDARSLVFAVPDGAQIPADRLRYSPGQFLTLRVPSDRTGSVARCYSLCSSPFTGDPMTVTVTMAQPNVSAASSLTDGQFPMVPMGYVTAQGDAKLGFTFCGARRRDFVPATFVPASSYM